MRNNNESSINDQENDLENNNNNQSIEASSGNAELELQNKLCDSVKRYDFFEGIKNILREGAKIDEVDMKGRTALEVAIRRGNAEMVLFLILVAEADPNKARSDGNTPVMAFIQNCSLVEEDKKQIIEVLLNAGANLERQNQEGKSVYDYVNEKDPALHQWLIKIAGTNPLRLRLFASQQTITADDLFEFYEVMNNQSHMEILFGSERKEVKTTAADIREAYERLKKRCDPNQHKAAAKIAEAICKKIETAFQVLTNSQNQIQWADEAYQQILSQKKFEIFDIYSVKSCYRLAVELDPKNWLAHFKLGKYCFEIACHALVDPTELLWQEAEESLLTAIRLGELIINNLALQPAYCLLAELYRIKGLKLGREKSIELGLGVQKMVYLLTEALKLQPTADIYWKRGSFYKDLGDRQKAFLDFNAALKLDPDCGEAKIGILALDKIVLMIKESKTKFTCNRSHLIKFDYFKRLLESPFKESTQSEIELQELESNLFQEVIHYTHEKTVLIDLNNVIGLYEMADQFLLSGLKIQCIEFIKQNLNADNKISMLQFSVKHQERGLEQACMSALKQDKNWVQEQMLKPSFIDAQIMQVFIKHMTEQEIHTRISKGKGSQGIIDVLLIARIKDPQAASLYEALLQEVINKGVNPEYTFEFDEPSLAFDEKVKISNNNIRSKSQCSERTANKTLFTPLTYSAKQNLTAIVLCLAPKIGDSRYGINYSNASDFYYNNLDYHCTALDYAVNNNNLEMVKVILGIKGIKVTKSSCCAAVKKNNLEMVKLMLDIEGIEVKEPFKIAFENHNLDIVALLLEKRASPNDSLELNQVKYDNYFEAATAKNWADMLGLFFEKGYKPYGNYEYFQYALDNGYPDVATLLLKWDPNMSTNCGNALHAMALSKHADKFVDAFAKLELDFTKLFVKAGSDENLPIHNAMASGNWKVTQFFIDNGAFDSFKLSDNSFENKSHYVYYDRQTPLRTPLDVACDKGMREFVLKTIQYLVKFRVSKQPKLLNELLNWAWLRQYHEIVKYLVAEGKADVNQLTTNRNNDEENSFLQQAVIQNRLDVVKFLVMYSANIDCQNKQKRTPLHEAASRGNSHFYILEYLLKQNANVNMCDNEGKTSLHHASEQGHYYIAQWLINNKARVNACDKEQQTPLHKAALKGHGDIVGLLTKAGANLTLWDKNGKTASHLVNRNNKNDEAQQEIIEYLDEQQCRTQ